MSESAAHHGSRAAAGVRLLCARAVANRALRFRLPARPRRQRRCARCTGRLRADPRASSYLEELADRRRDARVRLAYCARGRAAGGWSTIGAAGGAFCAGGRGGGLRRPDRHRARAGVRAARPRPASAWTSPRARIDDHRHRRGRPTTRSPCGTSSSTSRSLHELQRIAARAARAAACSRSRCPTPAAPSPVTWAPRGHRSSPIVHVNQFAPASLRLALGGRASRCATCTRAPSRLTCAAAARFARGLAGARRRHCGSATRARSTRSGCYGVAQRQPADQRRSSSSRAMNAARTFSE